MAAPSVTARTLPTGYLLPDGYQTTIAFALSPTVQFWEKTVKPPGGDSGGPIDISTMFNSDVRTFRGKYLKTSQKVTGKALFDPDCIPTLNSLLGRRGEGSITVHFPDNSTYSFYGYLNKYDLPEMKEGDAPELDYEIEVTNWDSANSVEQGPVYAPAAGT